VQKQVNGSKPRKPNSNQGARACTGFWPGPFKLGPWAGPIRDTPSIQTLIGPQLCNSVFSLIERHCSC